VKRLLLFAILVLLATDAHAQQASIIKTWTVPGDDGYVCTLNPAVYEMRWSTTKPDTTSTTPFFAWWATATPVTGLPPPATACTVQSVSIVPPGGWPPGTYYFAMRTSDEVPNWSGLSNVAVVVVPVVTPSDVTPPGKIKDYR
jgi:hypothetical protein